MTDNLLFTWCYEQRSQ